MRELLRKSPRFFLLAVLAGVALRLIFLFRFPSITVDSLSYGDIAKNWLLHGIYGVTGPKAISPTYTRLPGYPAFLAAMFAIFGVDHYRPVLVVQGLVDIGTCFVIADLTRRMLTDRAARVAFLLAALCPFFANYAAAALTETLEIFFTAAALDCAIIGLASPRLQPWIGCGLAVAAAILLRPDGGMLLVVIEGYLGALWLISIIRGSKFGRTNLVKAALLVALLPILPLLPWGLRNLRTLHSFELLTPRYANEAHEFVPMGFNRWVKTWIADYASVEEVYWQVPGDAIDPDQLPNRAYDSAQQRAQTVQAIAEYNQARRINPALDAQFAQLASQRISDSPLRYYLWLPAVRIADMWLRPRTEILPSDIRWWEFNDDPKWLALAILFGLINFFYLGLGIAGWWRVRFTKHLLLLLTFVVLRSLFLGTLENPEPRYVLECFPVLILLGAGLFTARLPYKNP